MSEGGGAVRAESIRVRGTVQGVGFRPTVWRIARQLGLRGAVSNDGEGVLIEVWGEEARLKEFVARLRTDAPPLARIATIERGPGRNDDAPGDFTILSSQGGAALTHVAADAATCADCLKEVLDPFARRYRYPFTNCTHCGPRLSIVERVPYDRANTTMAGFTPCAECAAEYADPADRRFHAQPIGCHACGPRVTLARADGKPVVLEVLSMLDAVDAACTLLQRGHVVAIQGLGGYQLACDATHAEAVARLRAGKRRERKPFALMARDLEVIGRHCLVSDAERALLLDAAAPIVLLDRREGGDAVAPDVAPGVATLGFMLPNTPLHHLLLRRMARPIVLTSGNQSDEPQAIERADARERLGTIAGYFLEHDRPIARRVDDSVVRVVAGGARVLRRARGYAPEPLPLPPGFENASGVLAYGGELKNTFCLVRSGEAILSAHVGDLQHARARDDYVDGLERYQQFFAFAPAVLACDLHGDYASTQLAQQRSWAEDLTLVQAQHHHAHVAACMADNGVPLDSAPILGVALDGLGLGDDGTLWGGEFLLADYAGYRRLGTFKPVAMPGGEAAIHEPWRNTYAQLAAQMGWNNFAMNYGDLELYRFLEEKPREMLDGMIRRGVNAPLASSCGRLFDAVAAAVGIAREHAAYEGQGAVELEAAVDRDCLEHEDTALDYPLAIPRLGGNGLPYIEPLAMWAALLGDLILATPAGVIAARFHRGLAAAMVRMVEKLSVQAGSAEAPVTTVALSGGVFQNRILFTRVLEALQARGFNVLSHRRVPCNDGGLALGQAAIAAARMLRTH